MKTRFLTRVTFTALLCLILTVVLTGSLQPFSALFERIYAQESEQKFWVFDGHMHPMSSVYRRGGTIGEPNADPRFTLPLAEQGGLGAAFVNTGIDEFYEANHLAVKDAIRQFDHFYRELAKYPESERPLTATRFERFAERTRSRPSCRLKEPWPSRATWGCCGCTIG